MRTILAAEPPFKRERDLDGAYFTVTPEVSLRKDEGWLTEGVSSGSYLESLVLGI